MGCDYNASETVQTNVDMDTGVLNVSFHFSNNPCMSIKDSCRVTKGADIKKALETIHGMMEYQRLRQSGYTRTFQSEYQEWKAHNFLYRIGYQKDRTGSVDIDQNESKLRKFIYAILSIF